MKVNDTGKTVEGRPILCAICHRGGGTLSKLTTEAYVHLQCFRQTIQAVRARREAARRLNQ